MSNLHFRHLNVQLLRFIESTALDIHNTGVKYAKSYLCVRNLILNTLLSVFLWSDMTENSDL